MIKRFTALLTGLLITSPVAAAQLPGTDVPYATYRQQMLENGWRPRVDGPKCGPYPETCMGRSMGTAYWMHPVDNTKVDLLLWPCKHGWCIAPNADFTD